MKETIYHNKEKMIENTEYLNQTSQNQNLEKNEKQVDNDTAIDNLVFV
jgi:hypothetical protein